MSGDKLSEYLKEFLLESKGRGGLLYDQASKLVKLLRNRFANQVIEGKGLYFESFIDEPITEFLEPYLITISLEKKIKILKYFLNYISKKTNYEEIDSFKEFVEFASSMGVINLIKVKPLWRFYNDNVIKVSVNWDTISSEILKPFLFQMDDVSINEFDDKGNIIKINNYIDGDDKIVKLKKPLDLFGYLLNKRNEKSYLKLLYFSELNLPFIDDEVLRFSEKFYDLIRTTKNTGDELSRDDIRYDEFDNPNIEPNKSYKYCWDEDFFDKETNQIKTFRRCEYKLPTSKRISVSKGREI